MTAISVIVGGVLVGFVILLATLSATPRQRRTTTNADGSVSYMGGGSDGCDPGVDAGCDGGGGDGGGGDGGGGGGD